MRIKFILSFALLLYSSRVNAQKNILPTFSCGYYANSLAGASLKTNNFEFGAGVQIYDHLWAIYIFQIHSNQLYENKSYAKFRNASTGVGVGYRILDENSIFSPEVSMNFGIGLKNSLAGAYINDRFNVVSIDEPTVIGRFHSLSYFGKVSTLLDVQLMTMHISFGANYCYYEFIFNHKYKDETYNMGSSAFGLELKFRYTIGLE